MSTNDELLAQSIRHWEDNLAAARKGRIHDISISGFDCVLCDKYDRHELDEPRCSRCPVYAKTQRPGCQGTPWTEVITALSHALTAQRRLIGAIEDEIAFLSSLSEKKEDC